MSKDNSSAAATESGSATKKHPTGDYDVGYCRPPIHCRYEKGKSGNPKGRTKGRRNVKTELREIVNKKFKVREGETEHKLSLVGANVLAHGVKGAKGDVRSASLFLSNAQKLGLLEDEEALGAEGNIRAVDIGTFRLAQPPTKPSPIDGLFEQLDLNLLSEEEQIELSRFAEIIDLAGGDFTALSIDHFKRLKHVMSKGRNNNVTSH
jgi:Family of unknown function (DUF5681)